MKDLLTIISLKSFAKVFNLFSQNFYINYSNIILITNKNFKEFEQQELFIYLFIYKATKCKIIIIKKIKNKNI